MRKGQQIPYSVYCATVKFVMFIICEYLIVNVACINSHKRQKKKYIFLSKFETKEPSSS